jgi:hypothetical protein
MDNKIQKLYIMVTCGIWKNMTKQKIYLLTILHIIRDQCVIM